VIVMGGGGSGGWPSSSGPNDVMRRAGFEANKAAYEGQVNTFLQDLLADFNNRDSELIRTHLETIEDALNKEGIGSISLFFGGSIKKHTYIDGLSDIDVLAKIENPLFAGKPPSYVLKYFAERLRERLPNTEMKIGNLAVTVEYSDGSKVQVLPAVVTATGVRIPNGDGSGWSNIIRPEKFAEKLTQVNKANNNGVVPVIKLYKAINARQPEKTRLSGYHIESIAINAFRKYEGPNSRKAMLTHLAEYASKAVLTPIADSTGQSINVDDKLGPWGSLERQRAGQAIKRIYTKMKLANTESDLQRWKELFGE
jgi:hypothetical protein